MKDVRAELKESHISVNRLFEKQSGPILVERMSVFCVKGKQGARMTLLVRGGLPFRAGCKLRDGCSRLSSYF